MASSLECTQRWKPYGRPSVPVFAMGSRHIGNAMRQMERKGRCGHPSFAILASELEARKRLGRQVAALGYLVPLEQDGADGGNVPIDEAEAASLAARIAEMGLDGGAPRAPANNADAFARLALRCRLHGIGVLDSTRKVLCPAANAPRLFACASRRTAARRCG